MAVTDLTDSLPWWTRQGAGPTGGPGAAPQGGVGGQPPPGVSPQAWMAYLAQMFNPVSSAEASPLHPDLNNPFFPINSASAPPTAASSQPASLNAQLNAGGSPVPSALSGGGPPVPASVNGPPTPPPGPMTGPAGPISNLPPGPGQPSPTPWFTPSNTPMPWQGPNPNAPAPDAQPAGPATVPGPLATGGAGGQGATSNPRFVQVDRPNAPAAGGPQGRGGPPQMTALNLAGLFGRGQPAVNPDAPAANAQPVSGVLNGALSKAPWSMGPLQKGSVWPRDMGPFTPGQTAARGLKQRYG
jgi:hypothetical protein